LKRLVQVLVLLTSANGPALANGIAGDRMFPSTLVVEDTQNDDEISLPTVSWLHRGANGDMPAGGDLHVTGEYSRSLTSDLSALIGGGWRRLTPGGRASIGWDNLELGLKYRTLLDEPHEFLLSTALIAEIGGTGARSSGAEGFSTVQPIVSFGKGFGDLPHQWDWLRPAAITGATGLALPTGAGTKQATYGLTLQYSLIYLDQHIGGTAVPGWAASLVPLVEFSAISPLGRSYGTRTTATANPGIAWVQGDDWQITAEAVLPLTRATGRGVGFIAQVHIFLDDFFKKPVFGD
jgi:hypothetical protein